MNVTIAFVSFFILTNVPFLVSSTDDADFRAAVLGDCENRKLFVRIQAKGFVKRMPIHVHVFTNDGSISLLRSTSLPEDASSTQLEFPFQDINTSEGLSCEVYMNDSTKNKVVIPCNFIRDSNCIKNDYLLESGESGINKISRELTNEEDMFYNVTVRTIQNCDKLRGTVVAKVKTNKGKSVRGRNVGFLLVGEASYYAGMVLTDGNGRAIYRFDVLSDDLGKDLWCSIAIDNPNLPFNQQVPCSMKFEC